MTQDTDMQASDTVAAPYVPADGDTKVMLHTTAGDITLVLYGDTPRHRDNFIKLVKAGAYNGVLFHRVIRDFMVQTGDPESVGAPKGKLLGNGDAAKEIDAEILFPRHYHHYGAVAAARQGDNVNPQKRSSGSQFYIVTGRKFSEGQLKQMDRKALMEYKQGIFNDLCSRHADTLKALRLSRDQAGLEALRQQLADSTEAIAAGRTAWYTPEITDAYSRIGGTPHLDGGYTVYGRVLDGMDVVERIQAAETDAYDRPVDDIKIISATVIE